MEGYKIPQFVVNAAFSFLFFLNIPLAVFIGFVLLDAVDSRGFNFFLDGRVHGLLILAVVMNYLIICLHTRVFKADKEKYTVAHLWWSVGSCYFSPLLIPALLISLYAIFKKRKLAKTAFVLSIFNLCLLILAFILLLVFASWYGSPEVQWVDDWVNSDRNHLVAVERQISEYEIVDAELKYLVSEQDNLEVEQIAARTVLAMERLLEAQERGEVAWERNVAVSEHLLIEEEYLDPELLDFEYGRAIVEIERLNHSLNAGFDYLMDLEASIVDNAANLSVIIGTKGGADALEEVLSVF